MADFFRGISSGQKYEIIKKLGEGGQGTVVQVKNKINGKMYAAKWYNSDTATDEQRQRMEVLVSRGCPIAPDKGIKYIWPIELISHDKSKNKFGYIMPLIDTERFVKLNQIVFGKIKQSNLQILSRISYLLTLALDTIHVSGLAYCDINQGNLMVEPLSGDIVVCDNDNVVINNANVSVKGVWEFMAPEVALGTSHPNAETDKYSVAVMLFYLWMWEHPMDGKKTLGVYSWDIPAKKKYFAYKPVFVFNPLDISNSTEGVKELKTCAERWERMCPPRLKELFTTVFTKGVSDPSYRIQLLDWQRVFLELNSNAIPCPHCNSMNVWDGKQTSLACFHCFKKIPFFHYLSINHGFGDETNIIVAPEVVIKRHHLNIVKFNSKANDIVGTIKSHPSEAKAYILYNNTDKPWKYKAPDGEYKVGPGQARALLPNGEIDIDGVKVLVKERE